LGFWLSLGNVIHLEDWLTGSAINPPFTVLPRVAAQAPARVMLQLSQSKLVLRIIFG
jgi:hypothetical protein